MPKYCYRCISCNYVFEIVHSITERLIDCADCETSGSLKRELFAPTMFVSKTTKEPAHEVRKRVEGFIEKSREDLQQQKKYIKK